MHRNTALALATPALAVALGLAGCSSSEQVTPAATTPAASAPAASAEGAVQGKLSQLGLDGKDTVAVINALDQTQKDKEIGLNGSVRQNELLLTSGEDKSTETSMPMPKDKTYVSVAPYVDKTHECFAHHLTGCQGEQVGKDFQVTVTDAQGKKIVDEKATTYENGFIGFWMPRDVKGTLSISGEQGKGSIPLSTAADAPTCITTLQLS